MSSAIEEEEEILLSIFPDEFEKVHEDTFKIRIDPETETDGTHPPTLFLTAQLSPSYPDAIPALSIDTIPSEADGTDLTLEDKTTLLERLNATSEENLGMAMVFTLVTALREETTALLERRRDRLESDKREAQAQQMKEEQKRFEGTKVTRESFTAWNAQFKAEQARRRAAEDEEVKRQQQGRTPVDRKLTGRQLFEGDTTLAQSDLKIGDAGDVEFDFSKFHRTTRKRDEEEEEEEEEVRHWAAETI